MISLKTAHELLERSRHRPVWSSPYTAVLLLLGMALGAMLANPKRLTENRLREVLPPQALRAVIAGALWTRAKRQRQIAAALTSAWEAIQLKDWDRAEQELVALLRRPIRPASARIHSLMMLAAVADNRKEYGVSQEILASVLGEPGLEAGTRYAARIALAGTALLSQQLTDAVRMIDNLSREEVPEPIRAQVELLDLFRHVVMGQVQDAVENVEERRALFRRRLGTRAGYGYALLAAALDRAGQAERAAELWRDATLLIRPTELLDRFGELASVARKYPATEWPV